eukprot:ANDGO_04257.mRNA.1 hypothetical protein
MNLNTSSLPMSRSSSSSSSSSIGGGCEGGAFDNGVFLRLPPSCLGRMFAFCNVSTIFNFRYVCKEHIFVHHLDGLWRYLIFREFQISVEQLPAPDRDAFYFQVFFELWTGVYLRGFVKCVLGFQTDFQSAFHNGWAALDNHAHAHRGRLAASFGSETLAVADQKSKDPLRVLGVCSCPSRKVALFLGFRQRYLCVSILCGGATVSERICENVKNVCGISECNVLNGLLPQTTIAQPADRDQMSFILFGEGAYLFSISAKDKGSHISPVMSFPPRGHNVPFVTCCAFIIFENARILALGHSDGVARLYNLHNAHCFSSAFGCSSPVRKIFWEPGVSEFSVEYENGSIWKWAATLSGDRTLSLRYVPSVDRWFRFAQLGHSFGFSGSLTSFLPWALLESILARGFAFHEVALRSSFVLLALSDMSGYASAAASGSSSAVSAAASGASTPSPGSAGGSSSSGVYPFGSDAAVSSHLNFMTGHHNSPQSRDSGRATNFILDTHAAYDALEFYSVQRGMTFGNDWLLDNIRSCLDHVGFGEGASIAADLKVLLKTLSDVSTFRVACSLLWKYISANLSRSFELKFVYNHVFDVQFSVDCFERLIIAEVLAETAMSSITALVNGPARKNQVETLQDLVRFGIAFGLFADVPAFRSSFERSFPNYGSGPRASGMVTFDNCKLTMNVDGQRTFFGSSSSRDEKLSVFMTFMKLVEPSVSSRPLPLQFPAIDVTSFFVASLISVSSSSLEPCPRPASLEFWMDHMKSKQEICREVLEARTLKSSFLSPVPQEFALLVSDPEPRHATTATTATTTTTASASAERRESRSLMAQPDRLSADGPKSTSAVIRDIMTYAQVLLKVIRKRVEAAKMAAPTPERSESQSGLSSSSSLSSSPSSVPCDSYFDRAMAARARNGQPPKNTNGGRTTPKDACRSLFGQSASPSITYGVARSLGSAFASDSSASKEFAWYIQVSAAGATPRRHAETLLVLALASYFDHYVPISRRDVSVFLDVDEGSSPDQHLVLLSRVWQSPCTPFFLRNHTRRILSLRKLNGSSVKSLAEVTTPNAEKAVDIGPTLVRASRPRGEAQPDVHAFSDSLNEDSASLDKYAEEMSTHYRKRRDTTHPEYIRRTQAARPSNAAVARWKDHVPGMVTRKVMFGSVDLQSLRQDIVYLFRLIRSNSRAVCCIRLGKLTWLDVPKHMVQGVASNMAVFPGLVCASPKPVLRSAFDPFLHLRELSFLLQVADKEGFVLSQASTTVARATFRIIDRSWHTSWMLVCVLEADVLCAVVSLPPQHEWKCSFVSSGRMLDRQLELIVRPPAVFKITLDILTKEIRCEMSPEGFEDLRKYTRLYCKNREELQTGVAEVVSFCSQFLTANCNLFASSRSRSGLFNAASDNEKSVSLSFDVPKAFGFISQLPSRRFFLAHTQASFSQSFPHAVEPYAVVLEECIQECGQLRDRGFQTHIERSMNDGFDCDSCSIEEVLDELSGVAKASQGFRWFRGT